MTVQSPFYTTNITPIIYINNLKAIKMENLLKDEARFNKQVFIANTAVQIYTTYLQTKDLRDRFGSNESYGMKNAIKEAESMWFWLNSHFEETI